MKIAQLVSNYHKVAEASNQAIYNHVAWLTNGLADRGNNLTLFASGDSKTRGQLNSVLEKPTAELQISEDLRKHYLSLLISQCYRQASSFDIIHSHFNLLSSFFSVIASTPTVQSLHSPINPETKPLIQYFKDNYYISFSLAQRKLLPELNWVANIYHGVDTQQFIFNPIPKDYFLYLGRITEEKGVHLAIAAALAANVPLLISGRSYVEEGYWHEKIEKSIDGKMIRYIGESDFNTKIDLLKNAKAVLFPTQYDEVFGLVMIEAMACGTPVIGWNKGSVSEVISDRNTGYVVNSVDSMVKAIKAVDKISREATRLRAEKYFSVEKMVTGYEKVYLRVIEEHREKWKKANNIK